MAKLPFLRVTDVARIWGEERARAQARRAGEDEDAAVANAKPLSRHTVWSILFQARSGRYADNPPPMPIYPDEENRHGKIPMWVPEGETLAGLERRLRAWYHSRPGPGAGGGRRAATDDHLGGPKGGRNR